MQEADKAYIAGFFDGEGCVYIYHRKRGKQENQYEPVVAITQKFPKILQHICDLVNTEIDEKIVVYAENNLNDKYSIRIYRASSIQYFLSLIEPYVLCKKEQLKIMFKYLDMKKQVKQKMINEEQLLSKQLYLELRRLKNEETCAL